MNCDIIFCIENGIIKAKGTYNELKDKVDIFKSVLNA